MPFRLENFFITYHLLRNNKYNLIIWSLIGKYYMMVYGYKGLLMIKSKPFNFFLHLNKYIFLLTVLKLLLLLISMSEFWDCAKITIWLNRVLT